MRSNSKPQDNLGGLAEIYAVPQALITAVTESSTANVFDVTISATTNVTRLYATQNLFSHTEEEKEASGGSYFDNQVSCVVPGDDPALQSVIDYLREKKLVIIYRDNNGRYKMVGDSTYAIRLSHRAHSGAHPSQLNKKDISFGGSSQYRSKFINNPF